MTLAPDVHYDHMLAPHEYFPYSAWPSQDGRWVYVLCEYLHAHKLTPEAWQAYLDQERPWWRPQEEQP